MSKIMTLMKKELWSYFATPTALIFLTTYLGISLFSFFWLGQFFTRNIADLRPLFEMMPLVMIFLVSTLTMRMWSEEKRSGTLEFLMTLPVKTYELVLGKFLACLFLVSLALALTWFLPVSVSVMSGGSLDFGPVLGAYLASLLLASAYTSIGLYVSSKTESQIISLIVTSLLCLGFYLIGSSTIVSLLGNQQGEFFKLFGTSSRFASISRGVMDLRDIYYYISLSAVFLVLNMLSLEKSQWSFSEDSSTHRKKFLLTGLLVLNVVFANFWLYPVNALRIDMTEQKMYSISEATKGVLEQLQEPLLIRAYFSERTHPLLAPLVPIVTDLLKEYQLVNKELTKVEVVDPKNSEELESEAVRKYGIQATSFQIADRYSASLVNSYFNIVVQYGNQFEVLGFNDIIDVKHDARMKEPEVRLRNLEYDLTRLIKKTMFSFNNTDNLFASLEKSVNFVAYISESSLPDKLKELTKDIKASLENYKKNAQGKLELQFLDPSQDEALAGEIAEKYSFSPQTASLFSGETFYFYLTLQTEDKVIPLGIPENFEVSSFNNDMDAALKRLAPGFLRTVGIYTPPSAPMNPMLAQYGMAQPQGKQFNALTEKLGENYKTESVNLDSGVVNSEIDTLLVLAPKALNEKQIFAIDQYLMKGASVVLVTSPIVVAKEQDGFSSEKYDSALQGWLSHFGINIPTEIVMDERSSGFPAIRKRVVQGYTIKEPYLAPYPFFVDIRGESLNSDQAITAGLRQVTMSWSSPILVDSKKNTGRTVTDLIKSSEKSWKSDNISIEADRTLYPNYGYMIPEAKEPSTLAVMVEGEFESFFKGKKSPLLNKEKNSTSDNEEKKEDKKNDIGVVTSVIEKSPKNSSLIIFASNEFVADDTIQIQGMLGGSAYLNSIQLIENTVDWILEDRGLLALRNRRHFARTLMPLADNEKRNWEMMNYAVAFFGLLAIYTGSRLVRRASRERYKKLHLA